jgi:hypothetical protein
MTGAADRFALNLFAVLDDVAGGVAGDVNPHVRAIGINQIDLCRFRRDRRPNRARRNAEAATGLSAISSASAIMNHPRGKVSGPSPYLRLSWPWHLSLWADQMKVSVLGRPSSTLPRLRLTDPGLLAMWVRPEWMSTKARTSGLVR